MKKWLKKAIAIGVVFLTAAGLSACGQNEGRKTDKKVTIEYFNQKKEMSGTLKEIIKDFEKKNPNIHVKEIDVPNAGTVLKTRMLSGDVPDVINIYPQNIDFQEWAKAGYFEDMTNASYIKNIKNHYADSFKVNGRIYNAPLSANVYGFFYNATEFEKLGIKPPKTWKEFEQIVKKIKDSGKYPFAVAGTEPWTLNGYHQLSLATVTGELNKRIIY